MLPPVEPTRQWFWHVYDASMLLNAVDPSYTRMCAALGTHVLLSPTSDRLPKLSVTPGAEVCSKKEHLKGVPAPPKETLRLPVEVEKMRSPEQPTPGGDGGGGGGAGKKSPTAAASSQLASTIAGAGTGCGDPSEAPSLSRSVPGFVEMAGRRMRPRDFFFHNLDAEMHYR